MHISTITRQGKIRTSPTGMEAAEPPFNRMRLWRKVRLEEGFSRSFDVSLSFGRNVVDGVRFLRF